MSISNHINAIVLFTILVELGNKSVLMMWSCIWDAVISSYVIWIVVLKAASQYKDVILC